MYNHVCGCVLHYTLSTSLSSLCVQIRTHAKRAQLMETIQMRTEPYAFDYFFEQSQHKRPGDKEDRQQEDEESSSTESESDLNS